MAGENVRGAMDAVDSDWQKIQVKAFTNWVNDRLRGHLREAEVKVGDCTVDLCDGYLLGQLVNNLIRTAGRTFKELKYRKDPRLKLQKLENLGRVLQLLKEQKIKTVNIGPEDLFSANKKLWLGLIWTLIDEFQISTMKGGSSKQVMLDWMNSVLPMATGNFTTDWNDGTRLCTLVDTLRPGLCPNHASLNPKAGLQNCELGMSLAEQHLQVPKLLDPADLNNPIVDQLSVMTYLSYFTPTHSSGLLNWVRARLPEHPIQNLTKDWNNGLLLSALVSSFSPSLIPDLASLKPTDALKNVTDAMKAAEDRLGVAMTLKASAMTNPSVDELSMSTYLAGFMTCKQKAAPGQCLADGPGLLSAQLMQTAEFTVDCGQAGSGSLEVAVKGPTSVAKPQVSGAGEEGRNIKQVTYVPQELGEFTVTVKYEKEAIPGSPFKVPVVDPTNVHVDGASLGGQGCVVGKPMKFSIDSKLAGPGKVEPVLFGPSGIQPLSMSDSATGTKDISSVPTVPGNYSLDVKFAGLQIPGSPFPIAVSDPGKCRLLTSFKDGHTGKVGTVVEVAVDTSKAGPGVLTAVATGSNRTVRLQAQDDEGNINTISFVPGEAGPHSIDVLWDGHSIPGCPLVVPVIDVSLCCFEDLPSYAQLAKPLRMRLLTQQKIAAPLHVQAQTENGSLVPAKVQQGTEEGAYDIQLTPAQVGTLEVDVTWAGEQVSQCPFDVHVCDAQRCSAYGPGLTQPGKVGEEVQFTVQAKDAGEGALVVRPTGPKAVYSAEVSNNGNGTYAVSFTPWEQGPHQIAVDWGTEPIPNSPFPLKVSGRILASQLTCTGPGLKEAVALAPAEFQIKSNTKADLTDGDLLAVTIRRGKEKAAIDLSNLGNGKCSVTYVAPSAGAYTIKTLYSGKAIGGSPYTVNVTAAPKASRCVVGGNFLDSGAQPLAGDPLDLTVATGKAGDGRLKVTATDPSGAPCRVFTANDTGDLYSVRVDTREPGVYAITAKWADEHIPGSPFSVTTSNRITSQNFQAHGPGLKSGQTGGEASFTIHGPKSGLVEKGELTISVANSSAELSDLKITDSGDGVYSVTYKPSVAEEHKVVLQYCGQNLPGSPFSALITTRPMADLCVAKGSLIEAGAGTHGEPLEFEVDTLAAGNGRLVVKAEGPAGQTLRSFQSEEEERIFSVRLDTTAGIGTYTVHCLWSGKNIRGSPFRFDVGDKLTAQMVSVKGDGLREVYAMREATFGISAKKSDLFDSGTLKVTVVGDSGHVGLAVADNQDGDYTVTYMAPTAGDYVVSVFLGGDDIPGSPFNVTAYLPPKADRCLARGHCLEPDGKMIVGKSAEFTVNTADAGHGKMAIKASDPNGAHVRTFLSDDNEGVHTVRLDPMQTGSYAMEVKWAGEHIPGSPFKLTASDSLSPGTITASGSGLSRAFSQMPTAFTLDTPEAGLLERNDITVTIDNAMRGKAAEVEMHDQGDGSYTVSYMAPGNGAYLASVKYRGVHIPNSPFKITVFPRPSPDKCRAFGKCLESKSGNVCGQPVEFKVATKDAGYGRLAVKAVDPQGNLTRAFVAEEGKNLYVVRVDAKRPGKYQVNVKWGQTPISGSPFKIKVNQASDVSKVRADGPGLRASGVPMGRETSFTIRTHDAGNASVVVRLHGIKDSFKIKLDRDTRDPRVLHAKYTPQEAGDYEVTILWDEVHIPGSPFPVPIVDPRGRQPVAKQPRAAAPVKKKVVKVTKHGMVYQDKDGRMVQTDDPAVIAQLEQERRLAMRHQQQQHHSAAAGMRKTTVEERRTRRLSREGEEFDDDAGVVIAGGLPPPRRRSSDQGQAAGKAPRGTASPAAAAASASRAVSPPRRQPGHAAAGQARALSPQRGGAPKSRGVAVPVTQPEYHRSQLARKQSRASYTDDDISPEFDNVFAGQGPGIVTQPHRTFRKAASTSNVEPVDDLPKPGKVPKVRFGRKKSEPVLRNGSISTKPRGTGFIADPSGESRRQFTSELRGQRPFKVPYS